MTTSASISTDVEQGALVKGKTYTYHPVTGVIEFFDTYRTTIGVANSAESSIGSGWQTLSGASDKHHFGHIQRWINRHHVKHAERITEQGLEPDSQTIAPEVAYTNARYAAMLLAEPKVTLLEPPADIITPAGLHPQLLAGAHCTQLTIQYDNIVLALHALRCNLSWHAEALPSHVQARIEKMLGSDKLAEIVFPDGL